MKLQSRSGPLWVSLEAVAVPCGNAHVETACELYVQRGEQIGHACQWQLQAHLQAHWMDANSFTRNIN